MMVTERVKMLPPECGQLGKRGKSGWLLLPVVWTSGK